MSVFVTNVASMIGIGVAVDYSLFVLARYREEIRAGRRARTRRAASRCAPPASRSPSPGVTVMISLAGLFLVDSTTIRSMAMGAIMVVAVSILAAVTLLPVLMRLLGRRAYARGRIALALEPAGAPLAQRCRAGAARPRPGRAHATFWERWTARVTRRPVAGRDRQRGGAARARHPRAVARVRRRRAAPVPQGRPRRAWAPSWRRRSSGRARPGPTQIVVGWTPANRAARRRLPAGAAPRSRGGEGIAPTALARRARGADRGPAAPRPREPPGPGAAGAPARRRGRGA